MSLIRRSLQIVTFLATLLVGATAAVIIVSQTAWFRDWLRGMIVRQANTYLNGQLTIRRLGGNLFYGVELDDVAIKMNGQPIVSVDQIGLDYSVFQLLSKGLLIDDIRLDRPMLYLRRDGEQWNISALIKKERQEADRRGPQTPIEIGEIGISDGTFVIDDGRAGAPVGTSGSTANTPAVDIPKKIDRIDAKLAFRYSPVNYTIEIGHVSFRTESPNIGLNSLSGRIATKDDRLYFDKVAIRTEETSLLVDGDVEHYLSRPVANVQVSSDKLAIDEIARLFPALRGIHLQPAFLVKASGPADNLAVELDVKSSAGNVDGKVTVDALLPQRKLAGEVKLQHLNLAPILQDPARGTDITGTAKIDFRLPDTPGDAPWGGLAGRFDVNAPSVDAFGYRGRQVAARGRIANGRVELDARALAYGGRVTAVGTITPPAGERGVVTYDLRGGAANLDLRNLPPQFNAPGVPSNLDLDYHVIGAGASVRGDVQLRPSTLAAAKIAGGTIASFDVKASGSARRPLIAYTAKGAVSNLDLQAVGRGFAIAALAVDRYRSAINGTFDVVGSGTDPRTLRLDASGNLTDSVLFGATIPAMTYEAHLAEGGLRAKANGSFANLDPAVVADRPNLKGQVTGAANVELSIADLAAPMTPDSLNAAGTLTLDRSTIGDLTLTRASVDGAYERRIGNIRELVVVSPDANVNAAGTIALDRAGQSNLKYHVDTADATRLAKLANQPIAGAITLDGIVSGNAASLRTHGDISASNISYQETNAMTVKGTYDVTVPELDAQHARVAAETHATFLKVAGRDITELTSKIEYVDKTLIFDATAQERTRQLRAAGSLLLHPDHQEVHLTNAALRAQNVEWTMEPGSEAAIQYGAERVVVKDVRLVSGDQRVVANGTIGESGTSLDVKATNVDLVQAQALALVDYGVKGRLNADARITGAVKDPQVNGQFAVEQGAFRNFTFQSLGGRVDYTSKGFKVDTRLQQNAQAWLTAVGYVPMAALRASTVPPGAHEEPGAGESIDLRVQSSPIDLGIIQGFTTELTNVAGTLQADVRVKGTAHDPHLDGFVDVKNGAFAVPFARTKYSGLDTRVEFVPDGARIANLTLVDEHKRTLTLSGELATHERQIGAMNLHIKADHFEIMDNEFADVKLGANLTVAGELRRPRIEGDLAVDSAQVFVDPILALTGNNYYATEATTIAPQPAPQTPGGEGTIFDALALNIRFAAPDNLVVKARDLKTNQSAFGAGALNVTVGGDIKVLKDAGQQIRLLGVVNTVRGTYDFQGRRFEILRDGRIRFEGNTEINPDLDITAQRIISGVEARVHIGGSMIQPELQLSSRPPLEEADILSLIVFGAPVNSLGEGQQVSLASRAGALATGFVASSLAESINSALELDVFEIQTTSDESGATGSVTLGEQLGHGLFVKFRQGFGAQPTSEFILEYELTDFLRLQGAIAENGGAAQRQMMRRVERGGLDLIFFFSY